MNYRLRVATVYLLGFFIDLVNMFISNVAYPAISHAFHASLEQLAWISNGYIIGLTLVIPASRELAQRLGAKRVLLLSLLTFLCATAGAGMANSLNSLILWRVLQGMGGGLLIPVGQTLAYSLYPPSQRARLSAMIMLIGLLAPALSPTLGGVIADNLGWRWVFFASLPLAALTLLLAACWLRSENSTFKPVNTFDFSGLVLSCAAIIFLLLGLTRLGNAGERLSGLILLLGGLVLLGSYVVLSLRKTAPLLNLRLIQQPLFRLAMLIYQFVPGIFTGVSLLAVLYLQNQLGMSATKVGALMLPWAIGAFMAISLTGKKFNQLGPRPLFLAGCLINGGGMASLALIAEPSHALLLTGSFALMGFGSSLCSSTAQSAAFLDFSDSQLADASALWNINRQLSFCLGITLIGLLFALVSKLNAGEINLAYRQCFVIAGLSALLPFALCLGIPNRALVAKLTQ